MRVGFEVRKTNLGDFGVLETLFLGNGIPVDVRPVASMLDDGEEEHGFRSRWLAFVGHFGLNLATAEDVGCEKNCRWMIVSVDSIRSRV